MAHEVLLPVLINLIIFGSITTMIVIYLVGRHKERMGLVEQGVNILDKKDKPRQVGGADRALKWGLPLMGIGVGMLLTTLIFALGDLNEEMLPMLGIPMTLLFGGGGLSLYYYIFHKREQEERLRKVLRDEELNA